MVRHERAGYWWAAVPKSRWPDDPALVERINKGWHKVWGDRRQQLVFIGTRALDGQAITAELNACLMPLPKDGPVDPKAWAELPDPFPDWRPEGG
jgi:G3E family GTPase